MNNSVDRSGSLSLMDRVIRFCLETKIVVFLLVALIVGWGILVAPFDWDRGLIGMLPRDPAPYARTAKSPGLRKRNKDRDK